MYTDPILAAARSLKHSYNRGEISAETYARLYAAVARAAEQESRPCANDPAHGPAMLFDAAQTGRWAACRLAAMGR